MQEQDRDFSLITVSLHLLCLNLCGLLLLKILTVVLSDAGYFYHSCKDKVPFASSVWLYSLTLTVTFFGLMFLYIKTTALAL